MKAMRQKRAWEIAGEFREAAKPLMPPLRLSREKFHPAVGLDMLRRKGHLLKRLLPFLCSSIGCIISR